MLDLDQGMLLLMVERMESSGFQVRQFLIDTTIKLNWHRGVSGTADLIFAVQCRVNQKLLRFQVLPLKLRPWGSVPSFSFPFPLPQLI